MKENKVTKAYQDMNSFVTDKFKQSVFAKTGGIIALHESWVVKVGGALFKKREAPSNKKDIVDYTYLANSFIHPVSREYIGDVRRAKWYIKYNMLVDDLHPLGVAIVLKPGYIFTGDAVDRDAILGYCGYSHIGQVTFKIGHKLFDENWTGGKSFEQLEGMWFTARGAVTIKTLEQAQQAAYNFHLYVS